MTDHSNHRVQVFIAEGQFLRTFSQKTDGQKLSYPWAIAIDSSDTVYVSENGPNHVSVFTSQGAYITRLVGQERKRDSLISFTDSLLIAMTLLLYPIKATGDCRYLPNK